MSLELKDFRCKLTVETHAVLEAEARAHGSDMAEIVRDILHAWALRKIDAASFLHRGLKREGLVQVDEGWTGKNVR